MSTNIQLCCFFDYLYCFTQVRRLLSGGIRELQSRAFLEEAECHIALGNMEEAHHSLHAAEEAIIANSNSLTHVPITFPAQRAAIQLCQSRLTFHTFEDACKPSSPPAASFVSPVGHKCCGRKKKGSAKTQKPSTAQKTKAACKWRSLLESHLWSLLECLQPIHCLPFLHR